MKRTGTIGPFVATTDGHGNVDGMHVKFVWPTDQKAIENLVLDHFLRERERVGATIITRRDGGTHDLDFRLKMSDGLVDLELMEVVIRTGKELPFQPGHGRLVAGEYANAVFDQVKKKIEKYGFNHEIPIDLLLYVTHEQYVPNGAALDVLRIYFRDRKHQFRRIYFLVPVAQDFCCLHELHNIDVVFELPSLGEVIERSWVNAVSSEFEIGSNGSISIQISATDLAHIQPQRTENPPWRQGRNDPCQCGSGRKFKHCHGRLV